MNQSHRTTPPSIPGKSPSRLPWILALVGIVIIPPVLLAIWYANLRTSNNSAVRKLEQEVRQKGEPLTLAELATNYPSVPDDENAAVALVKIWSKDEPEVWAAFAAGAQDLPEERIKSFDPELPYLGSNARRIPRDRALSAESLAAAELFLAENADHLDALRVALRQPRCHFKIDFEAGPAALLPHLSRLKHEAVCLQLVALVATEKGDATKAIQAVENISRTGQLLADEPTLISQLVRVSILSLTFESTEQILSRQKLTTDQLGRLQKLLEQSNLKGATKSALIYERPFSLSAFDPQMAAQVLSMSAPGDSTDEAAANASKISQGYKMLQSVGYIAPDRKLMLETFHEAIDLASKETPDALRQYEALFDEVNTNAFKFPPKLVSALMLPPLRKVGPRFASCEARRRVALTAVAVERYRREKGERMPSQLDALVPVCLSSVPEDPFDGKQLRFKKTDGGYTIYSIGPDREDNDGKERIKGGSKGADITFIVHQPTATPATLRQR